MAQIVNTETNETGILLGVIGGGYDPSLVVGVYPKNTEIAIKHDVGDVSVWPVVDCGWYS